MCSSASCDPIVLVNSQILIEMDPDHGAISRIVDKKSGITLAAQPGMAENYLLNLQLPDKSAAVIKGSEQKLTTVQKSGDRLLLRWAGPLTDSAGNQYDMLVEIEVKADDASLEFRLSLKNNTMATVQYISYPQVGGFTRFAAPGGQHDATLWAPTSVPTVRKFELPFEEMYLGYPSNMNMSFIDIRNSLFNRSLYISSRDTVARFKQYHLIQTTSADGKNKDIEFHIRHLPFCNPGSRFEGSPVLFQFHDSDWHAAGSIYRDWFAKSFGIADPWHNWIRQQSFFQMTMFMLPEGAINYTFKDIPKWARDARDHGVNAVMISGWNMGGHDNGYPYYTIDPRLGTWDELREGIRQCHAMGMKVYFFANYQAVMVDSDWYKKELSRYLEQGADGKPTWLAGWGMGTLWARMGHPKLMSWADPSFPQYRRIIVRYFAKLAEIGADGVHIDKMFPAALDMNPDLTVSPDMASWDGAIRLTQEIIGECKKYNPDWAMSFECNWDRMLQFTPATWWVGNMAIVRYVFPENAEVLLLASPFDYIGVNNAVRLRHTVQVAPMNFSRSMGWQPFHGLANYIKEVKAIQDRLQDTAYMGEVLDHEQVRIPEPLGSGVEYNVYRNQKTGKRVCILTNSGMESARQEISGFGGRKDCMVRVYAPFAKTKTVMLPAQVEIPGERIIFVEEM